MESHMPIQVHDFNQRILMIANYRFARPLSVPLRLLQPLLRRLPARGQYRRYFIVERGAAA